MEKQYEGFDLIDNDEYVSSVSEPEIEALSAAGRVGPDEIEALVREVSGPDDPKLTEFVGAVATKVALQALPLRQRLLPAYEAHRAEYEEVLQKADEARAKYLKKFLPVIASFKASNADLGLVDGAPDRVKIGLRSAIVRRIVQKQAQAQAQVDAVESAARIAGFRASGILPCRLPDASKRSKMSLHQTSKANVKVEITKKRLDIRSPVSFASAKLTVTSLTEGEGSVVVVANGANVHEALAALQVQGVQAGVLAE